MSWSNTFFMKPCKYNIAWDSADLITYRHWVILEKKESWMSWGPRSHFPQKANIEGIFCLNYQEVDTWPIMFFISYFHESQLYRIWCPDFIICYRATGTTYTCGISWIYEANGIGRTGLTWKDQNQTEVKYMDKSLPGMPVKWYLCYGRHFTSRKILFISSCITQTELYDMKPPQQICCPLWMAFPGYSTPASLLSSP